VAAIRTSTPAAKRSQITRCMRFLPPFAAALLYLTEASLPGLPWREHLQQQPRN